MSKMLNLVDALLSRGRRLHQCGQNRQALLTFRRILRYPDLAASVVEEVHSRLAELHIDRGTYRRARRHLAAALAIRPQCPRYYQLLAIACEKDEKVSPRKAVKYFRQCLHLLPDQPDVLADLGDLLIRLDRVEEGLNCLRQATDLRPGDPIWLGRLLEAMCTAEQIAEARELIWAARFGHGRDTRFRSLWEMVAFRKAAADQEAVSASELLPAGDGVDVIPFPGGEDPTGGRMPVAGEARILAWIVVPTRLRTCRGRWVAPIPVMLLDLTSRLLVRTGSVAFRVFGKGRSEPNWHEIHILATSRRDHDGRLPLWRGTCITWTDTVIAVGWDFAASVLFEQAAFPASRQHPVGVVGGRLRDSTRRRAAGGPDWPTCSEIMAHECGHTAQARRMGAVYWPIGGAVTLCREGERWYNCFENEASDQGLFGGIVSGSVCERLMEQLRRQELL